MPQGSVICSFPGLQDLSAHFEGLSSDFRYLQEIEAIHDSSSVLTEKWNARKAQYSASADSKEDAEDHSRRFYNALRDIDERHRFIFSTAPSDITPKVTTFLDLGCAPGGFSSYLLAHNEASAGVGITLPPTRSVDGQQDAVKMAPLAIFDQAQGLNRYKVHYVDILDLAEESYISTSGPSEFILPTALQAQTFDLVVAGAFPTVNGSSATHRETSPTSIQPRLVLSQLLITFYHLKENGSLLLLFSARPFLWTLEVLDLLRQAFHEVKATKGYKLHKTRSLCFLVCKGFKSEKRSDFIHSVRGGLGIIKTSSSSPSYAEGLTAQGLIFNKDSCLLEPKTASQTIQETTSSVVSILAPIWRFQYNRIYEELSLNDPSSILPRRINGEVLPERLHAWFEGGKQEDRRFVPGAYGGNWRYRPTFGFGRGGSEFSDNWRTRCKN